MDKGKKTKPFLNLTHYCQTNTHFFLELAKGERVGKSCCTVRQEIKTESRDEHEN